MFLCLTLYMQISIKQRLALTDSRDQGISVFRWAKCHTLNGDQLWGVDFTSSWTLWCRCELRVPQFVLVRTYSCKYPCNQYQRCSIFQSPLFFLICRMKNRLRGKSSKGLSSLVGKEYFWFSHRLSTINNLWPLRYSTKSVLKKKKKSVFKTQTGSFLPLLTLDRPVPRKADTHLTIPLSGEQKPSVVSGSQTLLDLTHTQ